MSQNTSRRTLLAGAVGAAALGASTLAAAAPPNHSRGQGLGLGTTKNGSMPRHAQQPGADGGRTMAPPLEFAYFRTWHDRAVDPTRPNSMGEIPAEIDLAFVFPDYTPDDSPFWTVLREEYVPVLHSRGTRAVRTTDIRAVLDPAFPDTADGHRANAEHLVETLVEEHALDGLDIDMERTLDEAETARAAGVFLELSRLIGPKSGTDRLFIYDTNRDGGVPLFQATSDCFDYVLVQSYGRSTSSLQATWDSFAPFIDPEQYLIGFSFYEENDDWNEWNDTSEPFEDSRAVEFADWQPDGATKGGIFSYAVDRDGVAFKDDVITHTTYEWSKALKHRMLDQA
ncbi:EndoS/ChiA family endoglycosidase [Brachybacterium tyrofermentans]|uniref:EndoS/ChiA family endoglycosidase n=1 Tax=Brachybacterium tyrofermentans TaxID=47848 RepID=UPI003FD55BF0